VSCDRQFAAALFENQASLAEFYRRFIQSDGEGITGLERVDFFRQKARLALTEELSSPLPVKEKKKSSKKTAQSASSSVKRGCKKTQAEAVPLEEWIHDQPVPLMHHSQTLDKETFV